MEVQINWLAVLLAALSTMIVGSAWYTKATFGSTWMKLIGKTEKDLSKAGSTPIVLAVVASFLTAFVLAYFTYLASQFYGDDYSYLQISLSTAFWVWLGFMAARFLTHDAFEGRPKKLTLITVGHELLTVLVMGLIIGLMQP